MKTAVLLAACMGGLAFGVTAVAVFERWSLISDSRPAERDKRERPKAPTIAPEEKRRVYPYSIVAGGARTVEEAKRAMNDPAVRAHYATVDLSKLKRVTLTADISGYVSYRSGDQIYWTAKKLVLKAGETVFTDGEHVVRGRCLNRYSPKPMFPVQTNPPSEKVLNTPVEVPLVALEFPPAPLPFGPPPLIPFAALTPTVPNVPGSPAGSGGRRFFPIIPIIPFIPPIHRHSPRSPTETSVTPVLPAGPTQAGSHPRPPLPTVAPVEVVAPEPDLRWALAAALICFAIAGRTRSRRSRV